MDIDSDSSDDDFQGGDLQLDIGFNESRRAPCLCYGLQENSQEIPGPLEQTLEENARLFQAVISGDVTRLVELAKSGIVRNLIGFRAACTIIAGTCSCRCARYFERYINSRQNLLNDYLRTVEKGVCDHWDRDLTAPDVVTNGYDSSNLQQKVSCHPTINALHLAVLCENVDIVLWLLKNTTIDINATTGFQGDGALHLAVLRNDMELVRLLVEHGADVRLRSVQTGQSLVMHAVQANNPAILQFLVDRGADVNQGVPNGRTPILQAVRFGHAACVEILVKAGVDQSKAGQSLLCLAIEQSRFRMAKMLLEGNACVNQEFMDSYGNRYTPLSIAMCRIPQNESDIEIVEKLLVKGADPNEVTADNHVPLHTAAYSDLRKCAKLLVEHGADVNKANDNGYCPLHHAAWDGRVEICKLLLDAGALHDEQTADRNTPLALGCHGDKLEVIKMLLERPCNVNNKDKDLDMPLHYTTYNGNFTSTQLLLDLDADPDAENAVNTTPIWNAVYAKHLKLVHTLLQYNVRLQVASRGLLQHAVSSSVEFVYQTAKTPLAVAWARRHEGESNPDIFRLLLLAGACINVETEPWIEALRNSTPADNRDACTRGRWMQFLSSPLSLKSVARIAIRRIVGIRMRANIHELELPKTLNDFLLLKEL